METKKYNTMKGQLFWVKETKEKWRSHYEYYYKRIICSILKHKWYFWTRLFFEEFYPASIISYVLKRFWSSKEKKKSRKHFHQVDATFSFLTKVNFLLRILKVKWHKRKQAFQTIIENLDRLLVSILILHFG